MAVMSISIICGFSHDAFAESCDSPLPNDIKVIQPSSNVPSDIAKFSGTWGNGMWAGKFCHTLIIENVIADGTADFVYSWGTYGAWNIFEGHSRGKGKIADGKLMMTFQNGAIVVTYWFEGEKLKGLYKRSRRTTKVTLVRK
mgnify:FL=1|jgi:hypothetical protein